MQHLGSPLQPRKGSTLKVLSVQRISTDHQDLRSLEDQQQRCREWIGQRFDGPMEWKNISGKGSGELLDRDAFREMEDVIESQWPDLLIVEDTGRICRRIDILRICELCEDNDIRVVAINDHVDTADPGWKTHAMFSTLHHEQHNRDTAARIRRSLRNRFTQGAVVQCLPFGYVKPPLAKTDEQIHKDPDAEMVYQRWFAMLEEGCGFSEISDWLNDQQISTGPYCRQPRWTPQMVARITRNPLLKGLRVRNRLTVRRVNKTGRKRSVKAPAADRLHRDCPHLAFVEPERYDRIIRMLEDRNGKYRRGRERAQDARQGVPRKRTLWPGQSMTCGICHRIVYYGAHGQTGNLMCSGAIHYKCWNAASVNGADASRRICAAAWQHIQQLPGFDQSLLADVRSELALLAGANSKQESQVRRRLADIESECGNLITFIKLGRAQDSIAAELERLEEEKRSLQLRLDKLTRTPLGEPELPSIERVREQAEQVFCSMPRETPEFARLMNQVVRDLVAYPVRLIDGGHIALRAQFTLDLSSLGSKLAGTWDVNLPELRPQLVVDLFDPPQRVRHMKEVIRLSKPDTEAGNRLTERQVAERLAITQPAVQRAKKLARQMEAEGMTDPYVPLAEPPRDYTKLRRHQHPRYRFDPLPPRS